MYKFNGSEITKERAREFIDDLAMFPKNNEDIELSTEARRKKYTKLLEAGKAINITDELILIKE